MNNPIITQNQLKVQAPTRPTWLTGWADRTFASRHGGKHQTCDPQGRLVDAIALFAVKDLVQPVPRPKLTLLEYHTAILFITNHADLYRSLGIPQEKLDELLHWAKNREVQHAS